MAASRRKFGEGRVHFGSDVPFIKRIPWGSLELELATWGGAPMGRVIRPWGSKHTAKSLVMWGLVRAAQQYRDDQFPDGLTCVYFNCEGQYDPFFTKEFMGVDVDRLVVEEGAIIEELTQKAAMYLEAAHVLVIDSIGQCMSRQEFEIGAEKGQSKVPRGSRARAWGQFVRDVVERMDLQQNMIVAIDQVRVNQTHGHEEASGSAIWAHNSSLDLHHRKTSNLYRLADGSLTDTRPQRTNYATLGGEVLVDGFEIGIEVDKSRVCRPFGKYRGRLDLDTMRWDKIFELKKCGLFLRAITRSGSYFYVEGDSKAINGHAEMDKRLAEDPSVVMAIYDKANKYYEANGYGRIA